MALETWSTHGNTRLTVEKTFGSSHLGLGSSFLLFVFSSFLAYHNRPPCCFLNDHVKCKSELAAPWLKFCFSCSCLSDEIPFLYMTVSPWFTLLLQYHLSFPALHFSAYIFLQTPYWFSMHVSVRSCPLAGKNPCSAWEPISLGHLPLSLHSSSPVAQLVKNPPTMWETWVWSLGWEKSLEKGKYCSILAWSIP